MAAPITLGAPGALSALASQPAANAGALAATWRARLDALAPRAGPPAGELAAPRAALGASAAGRSAPVAGEAVRAALDGLDRARARLDAAVAAARRGQSFSAGELLALQSDAYRFAQTVDLAARAVEGGAQAVRQAVQTPLG